MKEFQGMATPEEVTAINPEIVAYIAGLLLAASYKNADHAALMQLASDGLIGKLHISDLIDRWRAIIESAESGPCEELEL